MYDRQRKSAVILVRAKNAHGNYYSTDEKKSIQFLSAVAF